MPKPREPKQPSEESVEKRLRETVSPRGHCPLEGGHFRKRLGLTAVGLALVVTLSSTSCSASSQPDLRGRLFPTATSIPQGVDCADVAAEAAGKKFGREDYDTYTTKYAGFYMLLQRVSYPWLDIPLDTMHSETPYEEIYDQSPWQDPEFHREYEDYWYQVYEDCTGEPAYEGSPPPEKTRCIIRALHSTENEYGEGTVDYTDRYIDIIRDAPDSFLQRALYNYEEKYSRESGESPFNNPTAMAAFRHRADACSHRTTPTAP